MDPAKYQKTSWLANYGPQKMSENKLANYGPQKMSENKLANYGPRQNIRKQAG